MLLKIIYKVNTAYTVIKKLMMMSWWLWCYISCWSWSWCWTWISFNRYARLDEGYDDDDGDLDDGDDGNDDANADDDDDGDDDEDGDDDVNDEHLSGLSEGPAGLVFPLCCNHL